MNKIIFRQMFETLGKYRTVLVCLSLALITLAVFWQVHSFDFTNYDDHAYVSQNNHIRTGLKWDNIVWVFTSAHMGNWHPLTGLSHILDCALFGTKPGLHHLVSLLFHIANTLLLFTVLRLMTDAFWRSAFVAILFAVHPLHVESVVWISERKDVLSTFFWFLTIGAYFYYVKKPTGGRYVIVLILFAMGLMSKPMVVTLPFVLLLLDYWPLNRLEIKGIKRSWWSLVREKMPFFILTILSSIITFHIQASGGAVKGIEAVPLAIRILNAIISYVKYMTGMLRPSNLAVFYPYPQEPFPALQVLVALGLLAVITIYVIRFTAKYRYLATGWLWYLGTLVPVIGIVQVGEQALADRYTYIPLTGLFIIIAWGARDILAGIKYRKIIFGLSSSAVILVLAVCAWIQASYWHDNMKLFSHAAKVTNGNYLAYNNVGVEFTRQGKFNEAIEQFNHALAIRPNYMESLDNLGLAYGKIGKTKEEIASYQKAIAGNPNRADPYYYLAVAYNKIGRYGEAAKAAESALRLNSDYTEAYNSLGVAYSGMELFQEAVDAYKQAVKIKPDYAEAYNNLGLAYVQLGKFQEGVDAFLRAVQLKPDFASAYSNLGGAYYHDGRYAEAINSCKEAVKLKPDYINAHYNLGMSYLATGDDNAALEEYKILKTLDSEKAKELLNSIQHK